MLCVITVVSCSSPPLFPSPTPAPTWASINHGVTLCIECSGIHRGLGVHVSKVRSIKLDDWEESVSEVMLALGNRTTNGIMEFQIPPHITKPSRHSSRYVCSPALCVCTRWLLCEVCVCTRWLLCEVCVRWLLCEVCVLGGCYVRCAC